MTERHVPPHGSQPALYPTRQRLMSSEVHGKIEFKSLQLLTATNLSIQNHAQLSISGLTFPSGININQQLIYNSPLTLRVTPEVVDRVPHPLTSEPDVQHCLQLE